MGAHKSQLIARWGPPRQIMSDGSGGEIFIYSEARVYTTPGRSTTNVYGSARTNIYGNTGYTSGHATGQTTYYPGTTTSYDAYRRNVY